MSDYSIRYSTGWYSVSPGFAWWYRPIPNVDTVKQSQETKRVAQEIKNKEKADQRRVVGQTTIDIYAQQKKQKKVNKKLDLSLIRSNIVL